ncbi:carboxymuconolactone decarboxylase family protein [uncultured Microbacterium sp.]|uniref:Alkylhydroperoxidase AhpD family core domain protein n=1 Tax=uncultured Microbacterium sp. TaxID=191216 RepID=A0A1Y5P3L7_9MICO|nr:carboxymuconolactone decarboxylase family protein [uncultured Microbacterium sp.]SBS73262.1 Alkylhydroperoxidase AhpD family core domain protein [uncultured Microbacterium sp.]
MTEHNHPAPLGDLAGEMGRAFVAFDDAVFNGGGEIPRKYRELIALGVALTTQCDACLKGHARAAVEHGATDEELAETTYITAALRAGGGIVHGIKALGAVQRTAVG